jgi:hypothetical protein
MKRWWMIALVFTAALSLTSCAKRKVNLQDYSYGYGQCDTSQGGYPLGQFDVYTIRSASYGGLYELSIIPVVLDLPGDVVMITIANSSLAYKDLVNQVTVMQDSEINAGILTEGDLNTYDVLSIGTPPQPTVPFPDRNFDKDVLCYVPLPGDGINNQQPQPLK